MMLAEAVRVVRRAMYDMGATSIDVAKFLRARSVRGVPEDSDRCPVAVYLKTVVPDHVSVYVGDTDVCVSYITDVYVPMLYGLRTFVRNFDAGLYQDLIEPEGS